MTPKTDNVAVLRVLRDFYAGSVLNHPEKVAALDAAIAALSAQASAPDGEVTEALKPTPMVPNGFGGQEPAFRMDAYYYGFAATGIGVIDLILSAVACAGKAFHHTEQWNEKGIQRHRMRGETPVEWIQNAANDAADAIRAALAARTGKPGEVDGDVIHAAVAYFNGLNTKASLHMAAEIEKCYAALTHQEPAR